MVLIYLTTGDCIEVEAAARVAVSSGSVVCLDDRGSEVMRFPAFQVESFTSNPETAELLKDEVCEDLTVIEDEPEPEGEETPV
jgi:hypothetical protein